MARRLQIASFDCLAEMIADSAPGAVQAGRNVKAGYARAVGLEFENFAQLCSEDRTMQLAFNAIQGRSIVSIPRLMNIFLIMRYSSFDPSANIIEFGSYKGGSALFMAALARLCGMPNKIYALDTFEGMPPTHDQLDNHTAGDFNDPDLAGFIELKHRIGLDNLIVLKGLFHDTVRHIPEQDRRFALAHLDCDVYASMKFSLGWVKPFMVPSGYIICDDPLTATCLGAMQACEEQLVRDGAFAEQAFPHLVYRWPPMAAN